MTSREPESPDPPRSPTPLDYVDPHVSELEQDLQQEPDGNPGSNHSSPDGNPNPGDPDDHDDNDNDDDPADNPNPIPPSTDNRPEGDRFIEAIMHLSGSLQIGRAHV